MQTLGATINKTSFLSDYSKREIEAQLESYGFDLDVPMAEDYSIMKVSDISGKLSHKSKLFIHLQDGAGNYFAFVKN
jgi:hypothetical protein